MTDMNWKVVDLRHQKNGQIKIVEQDGGFKHIANVMASNINCISHAHLIAAAPAMYEALQAVSRLDYLQEHSSLAAQVRAALAQAEGQQ